MPETYETKSGQKVTTYYKEAADSEEKETKFREKNEDRVQLNKDLRSEQEGIFKKAVRLVNPAAPAAATASGKGAVKKVKAAGPSALQNLGKNVGAANKAMSGPPVWLRDNYAGGSGKKTTQRKVSGSGLPDWVLGRGAPWDPHGQRMAGSGDHGEVVKVVVTRTHADGTKTRTYRTPHKKRDSTPSVFKMPY
jgi:hypothetical protein